MIGRTASRASVPVGKRLAFTAVLLLLAIGTPLLLGEALLRLFFPQSYMIPRLVSSTAYGHALPRDTAMVEELAGEWRFTYGVNALGYRGPLVPPAPNPAGANLVVLGDSYSFGEGVDDGEEYPAALDGLLPATDNVVNLSVPGYGLTQQIRWYHELGRAYAPRLVILQYTDNDLWENVANPVAAIEDGRFRFADLERPLGWLKDAAGRSPIQYSQLYNLLRESGFVLVTALSVREGRGSGHQGEADLERHYLDLLRLFAAELRAEGVGLLFLPVNHELERHPQLEAGLRELDDAGALELLPVEDWFAGLADFGSPEGHIWGARAHRLIAEQLARRIRSRADP